MFVGHYGVSFPAKRVEPSIPLWVLFLAVQFLDFRGPVERRDGTSVFVYDPDGVKVELRIEKKKTA